MNRRSRVVRAARYHVCCLVIRGSTSGFLLLRDFSGGVSQPTDQNTLSCRVLIFDLS